MISTVLLLPLAAVYLAVNLVVMLLYGDDKRRARRRGRRTPERTLLLAALPGPFGALAGMSLFRHKTRKPRFVVAIPLLATLHCAVLILLLPGL